MKGMREEEECYTTSSDFSSNRELSLVSLPPPSHHENIQRKSKSLMRQRESWEMRQRDKRRRVGENCIGKQEHNEKRGGKKQIQE